MKLKEILNAEVELNVFIKLNLNKVVLEINDCGTENGVIFECGSMCFIDKKMFL